MHELIDLLVIVFWVVRMLLISFGMVLGLILAWVVIPLAFRLVCRMRLRRKWRADEPLRGRDGEHPEWRSYDPDLPSISRRCVCHGRRLHPGEQVLTWQESGPFGLRYIPAYCERIKESA